jgi:predicted 3-demethylubiquinone-9 3-methyltransferase (glyoxalase superfamily)
MPKITPFLPAHPLTSAITLFVHCENQQEVDELWRRLIEGCGKPGRCGWLTDKFGLSWQILPRGLGQMLSDPDTARSQRALKAMLQRDKIDPGGLERAYAGE